MKQNFWLASLALSAIIMQSPSAVYACPQGMHHIEKMVKKLDLTPDQKNKINAIHTNVQNDLKEKFKQMQASRQEINQLLESSPVNESKVNILVNQEKEQFGEIVKLRINTRIAIGNILTEPQRIKFREMFKKWEEKRKSRWEKCKKHMQDKN